MRACLAASAIAATLSGRRWRRLSTQRLLASLRVGVTTQHRTGAVDEQGAQVHVTVLGHRAETLFAAAGMLPWRESQPGGKLAPVAEHVRVTDTGHDADYIWDDVAQLTRQSRIDFGAQITWIDPVCSRQSGKTGWAAFSLQPPVWIQDWIEPDALGALREIKRNGDFHATLARVTFDNGPEITWLLLVKPSLSPGLTEDILNYSVVNEKFPQDPATDQIFDDIQWESYRALGQQIGRRVTHF